jgi:formylglycine-generating enzyme required for sulfatase activity
MMKQAITGLTSLLVFLFACRGERAPTWTERTTGMQFVLIPAGKFVMGSPPTEPGREPQEVQHLVSITHSFYLGRYEVTQRQWQRVMGSNPSFFKACGPECPVERVNWYEANTFIQRFEALTSQGFRLPTEAEWEYACRAGTTTPFSTGSTLTTNQANYDGERFRGSTVRVGSFPPNAWGLFDMHGNVWEWTSDLDCPYPDAATVDPTETCRAEYRVIRGGSWNFDANSARSALRYTHRPEDSGFGVGFRVVKP